jgi:putative tryptophan/tyrosine transport system substrate-binding protein
MRRREFVIAISVAVAAWPLALHAQQPPMPVVGYLGLAPASSSADRVAAMRRGLHDLGYTEGTNVVIDFRWAEGPAQLRAFAADLANDRVALIITSGNAATLAAKSATSEIPIVFSAADDPVRLGLVASFNRPGGNLTGVSLISGELVAKRLDLLHKLIPNAAVIALLRNPSNPAEAVERDEQAAAHATGQNIVLLNAVSESEIDAAFAELAQKRVDALLVNADATFTAHRAQIIASAARLKIPALYPWPEYAEAGGLISYGTSLDESYHQLGVYAGRILRGVGPADLPVTQPTKIELVINLKTAKTLGIEIPAKLLALADEVIE